MTFQEELAKVTDPAIKKVCEYLLSREDIQDNLNKEKKSVNGMWAYIKSQAHKAAVSGCACVTDEEVFGWAVHYYDEDNLEEVKDIPTRHVATSNKATSNKKTIKEENMEKTIKLLEKQVQEANERVKELENASTEKVEEVVENPKPKKKKKSTAVPDEQMSMFDFQVM